MATNEEFRTAALQIMERHTQTDRMGAVDLAHAHLVLEGDWGGQIYLTVPWTLVGEDPQIAELHQILDEIAWACNGGEGMHMYFVDSREEDVAGGMGGGLLCETVWMHPKFAGNAVVEAEVRALLKLAPGTQISYQ